MPTPLQIAAQMANQYIAGEGIPGRVELRTTERDVVGVFTHNENLKRRSFDLPADKDELGDMVIAVIEWVRGLHDLPTLGPKETD